ncbi:daunorubicin resistance ABC transporter ATPase subunit [Ignisphaera aggregans DSM 17230]|uniref:Daunorubicin resistance ABC transporter ATPase subunit n=1 Tax=Ignisphaera aggregans (strain DSM 17230 / JCM 13409 / AQ1.S1) TaxID=583356 RepID=E0SQM8_IGNAA|nr:daunorubicin resistance ABC transporter ATPase subunit [Ignisphaera aggregans DSM 17230]
MDDVIVVENLVKKFKDVVAVNGISFSVKRAEIFGLLGPNGAGKTTTIHIIATLLRPTSGRVMVVGYDVVSNPYEVRKRIGIIFQDPSLDMDLSAYDNMYIHGRLYGLRGEELHRKIMELLDFVDLKQYANKIVRNFSGGMRRRLELARGLLHEPEILILDEPTIGLDPQTRARIWEYITRIQNEKGITILMTTHYMDEAEELCHRIAIMDRGKIVGMGTADELKQIIGSDIVIAKFDKPMCIDEEFVKECKILADGRTEIVVSNASKILPQIFEYAEAKGVKILEISYRRPTLNEVFLHLTGRELRESLEEHPLSPKIERMRRFR